MSRANKAFTKLENSRWKTNLQIQDFEDVEIDV